MQNMEILLFAIFYNQEIFVFDLYIYIYIYCYLTISTFDMTQKKAILIFDIYNEQLSIFHMKHNIKLFNSYWHFYIFIGKNVYIVCDAQPFYDIWQFSYFTEKRNFAIWHL